MSDVVAIIPARSGSKSVKDKNIANLYGHPVIAYSIAATHLSHQIDRIIISTDSEHYASIAKKYGAEVPFLRPAEFSGDNATDRGFLIHAMSWFEKNEGALPEYWVHLRPTTVLRMPSIVDQAILEIKNRADATSLRSGHKAPESPLKWFSKDDAGYFQGLLGIDAGEESYNLPKEHFRDVYIPDGYVDVVKASHVINNQTIHGDKMIGFESPVCTEIDSQEELDNIEFELSKRGSPLLDFLNSNYGSER